MYICSVGLLKIKSWKFLNSIFVKKMFSNNFSDSLFSRFCYIPFALTANRNKRTNVFQDVKGILRFHSIDHKFKYTAKNLFIHEFIKILIWRSRLYYRVLAFFKNQVNQFIKIILINETASVLKFMIGIVYFWKIIFFYF